MLPSLVLVPAFGLSALALPVRLALGFALALAVLPAMQPTLTEGAPWLISFGIELMRGLPVALGAAAVLWTASMAGGFVDNLRGARETSELPFMEEPTPPLATLLALITALAFLETGGAARVAEALAGVPPLDASVFRGVALNLVRAVDVAVAIAAPLAGVSIVMELAAALIARAAAPAHVQALVAPLRSLALLFITLLVFERMASLLAILATKAPR
jgi:type III secretory pathway component EscT